MALPIDNGTSAVCAKCKKTYPAVSFSIGQLVKNNKNTAIYCMTCVKEMELKQKEGPALLVNDTGKKLLNEDAKDATKRQRIEETTSSSNALKGAKRPVMRFRSAFGFYCLEHENEKSKNECERDFRQISHEAHESYQLKSIALSKKLKTELKAWEAANPEEAAIYNEGLRIRNEKDQLRKNLAAADAIKEEERIKKERAKKKAEEKAIKAHDGVNLEADIKSLQVDSSKKRASLKEQLVEEQKRLVEEINTMEKQNKIAKTAVENYTKQKELVETLKNELEQLDAKAKEATKEVPKTKEVITKEDPNELVTMMTKLITIVESSEKDKITMMSSLNKLTNVVETNALSTTQRFDQLEKKLKE